MNAGDVVIATKGLSKRYKRTDSFALKDLDLQIKAGEVYGFLGPNGAGKSTTIRTLMNFIQPTRGSATIMGLDIVRDSVRIKRSIGYLSSDMAMYDKMTGHQFLDYMAELQPGADRTYRRELVKRFTPDLDKKLGSLSRGNKQKVGIVQAFMHQPQVLIMDEPSSGLDPLMQEAFYDLIKESRQRGAAVFMSSHILSEVQRVCDRVGIIREGRLVVERDIAQMTKEAAHTLDVTFAGKTPVSALKAVTGVRLSHHDEHTARVHVHGELAPLLAELSKHDVVTLDARQLDLEEMFMRFYNGNEGED
ncbi:MAG TPA: ABC transporter ATP-binding protein [Candidatus Saccharimonadales bacterium]|nr:ABC transporter ATP-binding protein [Candidatus Saccharimonadales bacterium]